MPRPGEEVHLLLCIADHFEPHNGRVSAATARTRVESVGRGVPPALRGLPRQRRPPAAAHVLLPGRQYNPEHLDALAGLCRAGFGEVEVHLHHDGDTADGLRRATLAEAKDAARRRHGLLPRHRGTGRTGLRLRPRQLGPGQLPARTAAGAGSTMSSTSSGRPAVTPTSLFPRPRARRRRGRSTASITRPTTPSARSRTTGASTSATGPARRRLDVHPGAVGPELARRKRGSLPRLENGCIQGSQPPGIDRLDLWLQARVQVRARPDWYFVKLHTHGAEEYNQRVLLGQPMAGFHEALARRSRGGPGVPFPLRDGPRDVQPRAGRRGGLDRIDLRGPGLSVNLG